MNEIEIDGRTIRLPSVSDGISIKDITGINAVNFSFKPKAVNFQSVIAQCDKTTLAYMKEVLKSLEKSIVRSEGAVRLAYITMHEELLNKLKSYTVVKEKNSNAELNDATADVNFEDFSKPEVHSMIDSKESEIDAIVAEYSTGGKVDDAEVDAILTERSTGRKVDDAEVDAIVAERSTGRKVDDAEVDAILAERSSKNNTDTQEDVRAAQEETEYRVDPSQEQIKPMEKEEDSNISLQNESQIEEKQNLFQKLQQINNEGRIFTDESRISDDTLNIQNAISLGKVKSGNLNVNPSKTHQVNTSANKLLEVGNAKFTAFKKACGIFNKKLSSIKQSISEFKIKDKLMCRYNQICSINISKSTIAEMSKSLSRKISKGSRNIAVKAVNSVMNANQKIKNQLVQLRERLTEENISYETSEDMEQAKTM